MLYIHVPTAWLAFLAFGVTALGSALYLFPKTRSLAWDRVAGASAEIGVLYTGLTLVAGSIWGRITWGVYWTWDARLTTTALLFVLFLGYLALRRLPATHEQRAKRCAIAGLIAFIDVPIVLRQRRVVAHPAPGGHRPRDRRRADQRRRCCSASSSASSPSPSSTCG